MAPGKDELEQDMPFVGGSGALLWSVAKDAGITRDMCYIVNVIGEFPAKSDGSPSAEQLARYRPAFERGVAASKSKIVVPLGGDAFVACTGLDGGIESWRGYVIKPSECVGTRITQFVQTTYKAANKKKGIKRGDPRTQRIKVTRPPALPETCDLVLPTIHPAAVMLAGRKPLPAFNADWQRVGRYLRGEPWPSLEFKEDKNDYLPILHGPFVVDVETMPFLRVGMAGRDGEGRPTAWSRLLDSTCRAAVFNEYASPNRILVAHNAQFDLAVLAEHNMSWDGPIADTMLMAALLQPDLYKGLNEVASLYLDRPRWKNKADEDNAAYNLEDAKVEFELYEILDQLIHEEGMDKLFYDTLMPALRTLTGMTRRGIVVDEKARQEWFAELQTVQEKLLKSWVDAVGNVDPESSKQLIDLLYFKWDLPQQRKKKTGRPTIERWALYECIAELKGDDPRRAALVGLMEYRKNATLINNFAKKGPGSDGCIHPYYLPITKDSDNEDTGRGMAGTGRIQARNPNVQQLPPDSRKIVIPREGMVLASFDYKQLELRIAANASGDALLQADIVAGIFEKIMGAFGCDRTRAKNLVYGTLYGGGPTALQNALKARGIKTTKRECKEMQDAFAQRYPVLWAWRTGIKNTAMAQKCLRNAYGRVRYFYDKGKDAPAALDFYPQSTAADVVWSDLPLLESACARNGGHLLATIHDEFLAEFPEENLAEGIMAAKEVLERHRPEIGCSLPVGVKIGKKNWKEMDEWVS